MTRRGFALLTVLWVLVVAGAIAVAGSAAGVDAASAHKNRVNATRARWHAHACANRMKHAVDLVLLETPEFARDSIWRTLDTAVARADAGSDTTCNARLIAAGSRLSVNTATQADLERMFAFLELPNGPPLAAAVSDWIDPDDTPREGGAERATYTSLARREPRNGPLSDVAELRYVVGMEQFDASAVLTADSTRVALNNAPLPVLAALPGFGIEVLTRIAEWRATGRQISNLLVLAASVSKTAENAIINSYPEIARATTTDPEAWYLVATASSGIPAIESTIELRMIRAQTRAVVMRRRVW